MNVTQKLLQCMRVYTFHFNFIHAKMNKINILLEQSTDHAVDCAPKSGECSIMLVKWCVYFTNMQLIVSVRFVVDR